MVRRLSTRTVTIPNIFLTLPNQQINMFEAASCGAIGTCHSIRQPCYATVRFTGLCLEKQSFFHRKTLKIWRTNRGTPKKTSKILEASDKINLTFFS